MRKAEANASVASQKWRWRACATAIVLLSLVGPVYGQEPQATITQLWFDYNPTWPLNERLIFDLQISSRIALTEPRFWELDTRYNLEFSPKKWVDLTGGLRLIYADQSASSDTFEVRPHVGLRLNWTTWRGVKLSNYSRVEFRIRFEPGSADAQTSDRLRDRVQALIPINKQDLSENGVWYAIADAEWFWISDQESQERFHSQRRYRVGVGWKKSAAWSFQFIYTLQRARDTAGEPFSTTDNIFRFRFIQTFK
jgi:hypothetical protein